LQAVWSVLEQGRPARCTTSAGQRDHQPALTEIIIRQMGRTWDESVQYVKDRPGHDRRYAIDASKSAASWAGRRVIASRMRSRRPFNGIATTKRWWRSVKSGEYLRYYDQQYAAR